LFRLINRIEYWLFSMLFVYLYPSRITQSGLFQWFSDYLEILFWIIKCFKYRVAQSFWINFCVKWHKPPHSTVTKIAWGKMFSFLKYVLAMFVCLLNFFLQIETSWRFCSIFEHFPPFTLLPFFSFALTLTFIGLNSSLSLLFLYPFPYLPLSHYVSFFLFKHGSF